MTPPTRSSDLRERVLSHEVLIGTFLNLGSPLAAEACALAGYDWLLVDLEHGFGGEEALLGQLLAAEAHGVPTAVRVESVERIRSGRVLDLGAAGVMFPRLESAREVTQALAHLRFPPKGDRGVATYNRACGFGLRPEVLQSADDKVLGIVQIESLAALEDLSGIAAVDGVDVLFVGPRDLSHALGIPGGYEEPAFKAALGRVVEACRAAGVAPGLLASSAEAATRYVSEGFRFIGIGSDSNMLADVAFRTVSSSRAVRS